MVGLGFARLNPTDGSADEGRQIAPGIKGGMMWDWVIRNGRIWVERDRQINGDLAIQNGLIAAWAERSPSDPPSDLVGRQELDAAGGLVSPPFVESHIHLDSALTAGEPRWNQSGTLFEGIEIWGDRKQTLQFDEVKQRAIAALRLLAEQGTLVVRSHADASEPSLTALQALLAVRDEVRDWITVQVVAFPQDGVYGAPGNRELLARAVELGADVVGGIPHYELTAAAGAEAIATIFDLAERHDRPIDLHCDEIDDPNARNLEHVAAECIRRGNGDRVTASHTCALASYDNAYALKLMGILRRARLNFVANPLINITLQGRTDPHPKRRGMTRLKELWQAGLNVSLGSDCLRDPWYSLGTGSALDAAYMAVHVGHMTGLDEIDACFDMATWYGAKTLGIGDYGLKVGQPANLIILDAATRYEAIRTRSRPRYVISRGNLLLENPPVRSRWS